MSDKSSSQALKDFISETEEIIESLNFDLVKLADCVDSGDCDPDVLNGIFRGAHSIKGLAGMFGFDDLSALSHSMENLLDGLRLGKVPFNQFLVDTLFSSLDILVKLIDGKSQDENFTLDLSPILKQLTDVAAGESQSDEDPLAGLNIDASILNVLTEYEEHRLLENVRKGRHIQMLRMDFDLGSFDQELAEITQQLKQQGEVISTLPSAGDIGERIAFQILFGSDLSPADIEKLLGRDGLDIQTCGAVAQVDEPEEFVIEEPRYTAAATSEIQLSTPSLDTEDGSSSLRSISRTVRVDIDKLDLLMNIVGELVLSKSSITNIGDRLRSSEEKELATELGKATRILERRLHELQKSVMDVRMVPVGQLFDKMTRIVRRVSNEQGKKVDLEIRGADTELDKLIIEIETNPFIVSMTEDYIGRKIRVPEHPQLTGAIGAALYAME